MYTYIWGIYTPLPHASREQHVPQGYPPTPYIYTYPIRTTHPPPPTRLAFTTVPTYPRDTPYPRYPTYLSHPVPPTRHGNPLRSRHLILPERHVRRFRLSELVRHTRNVRPRNLNPRWQTFKLYFFHASAREGPGVPRAGPPAPRPSPWLRGPSPTPLARGSGGVAAPRASVTSLTRRRYLTARHAPGKLEVARGAAPAPNLTERSSKCPSAPATPAATPS